MKNLQRALSYFRADAGRLVFVFLLMLGSIALNVLKPWPLAILVDSVLGKKAIPGWLGEWGDGAFGPALLATFLSIGILILHVGQGALAAIQNFVSIKIGLGGLTRVRNEVFGKLQKLSLRFHQGANSGDLIYRASWDTYSFQTLFQQGLVTFATAFLSLVMMIFVMAQLNIRLMFAALCLVPLVMLTIKTFGKRMNERTSAAQKADSQVTSLVQQSIAAMPLIQSYTREENEKGHFSGKVSEAEQRRISQHGSELLYWFGIAVVFGIGVAGITWLGTNEVLAGNLTVGQLLVFLAYLAQLYEPLNQLSHVGATVSGAMAGVQRVFEILDAPEEVQEKTEAKELKARSAGRIEFQNVSFGYEKNCEVLRDISFTVNAGESVALIGPSGAGKTTLLNLLPRFFDPTSGSIKLDGVDLRELRLKDLRSQVALVLQQPIILPTTIAGNIAFGKPGASIAEIEAAARAAHADEFIQKLPKKYESIIGDGAARLSIGEQQRLNLARAFLKDAPILLLDEPTSALDAESEALVLESLQKLMRGRTTLLVAHRLKTIQQADRILVLQDGRLLESGTRDQLATSGGYYARLAAR